MKYTNLRLILIVVFFLYLNNMNAQINENAELKALELVQNRNFPNNPELPVLLYKNV